jgi:Ulp1 family protease
MSTNVSSNSADHWLLGVISFKLKAVVILDSLGISKNSHINFFEDLFKIVQIVYLIDKKVLDFNQWSFYFDKNCPKQQNSFDCGLFCAFFLYSIFKKFPYKTIESTTGRKWICKILQNLGTVDCLFHQKVKISEEDKCRIICSISNDFKIKIYEIIDNKTLFLDLF